MKIVLNNNILFVSGNLFEMLRRCLGLPEAQAVVPILPSIWFQLDEIARNNFRNFL